DVILHVGQRPIEGVPSLQEAIELAPIGEELSLTIDRQGRRLDVKVRPQALPVPVGSVRPRRFPAPLSGTRRELEPGRPRAPHRHPPRPARPAREDEPNAPPTSSSAPGRVDTPASPPVDRPDPIPR